MTNPINVHLRRLTEQRDALRARIQQEEERRRQAEAARVKDEHDRLMRMREQENYRGDTERLCGAFERYRTAPDDHAEIIRSAASDLLPSREFERRHPNYSLLPFEGRVITLAAFLGIKAEQDAYARLIFGQCDFAQHQFVFRHMAGPADLRPWRDQLATITSFLGANYAWTVTQDDATHVRLSRHEPLPDRLPLDPAFLRPDHLFLGIDPITRKSLDVRFADLTHLLLVGASGTGKSNALHVLCRSLFTNLDRFDQVYLVDGKDGVAFNRYRTTAPDKVTVIWEPDHFVALIRHLTTIMTNRNAAQREAGIDNATDGFIAVVIDELAAFMEPVTDKEHRKAQEALIADLTRLARRGRSVGIRLIVTVQDPTEQNLPTSVRSQLQSVLSFRLAIPQHVSAVFGEQAELPVRVRDLTTGRAIYQNKMSGTTTVVQLPMIAPPSPGGP